MDNVTDSSAHRILFGSKEKGSHEICKKMDGIRKHAE